MDRGLENVEDIRIGLFFSFLESFDLFRVRG